MGSWPAPTAATTAATVIHPGRTARSTSVSWPTSSRTTSTTATTVAMAKAMRAGTDQSTPGGGVHATSSDGGRTVVLPTRLAGYGRAASSRSATLPITGVWIATGPPTATSRGSSHPNAVMKAGCWSSAHGDCAAS